MVEEMLAYGARACGWGGAKGLEPAPFGTTICRHLILRIAGCSELRGPTQVNARLQAALSGIRAVSESARRDAKGVSFPEYSA